MACESYESAGCSRLIFRALELVRALCRDSILPQVFQLSEQNSVRRSFQFAEFVGWAEATFGRSVRVPSGDLWEMHSEGSESC